MCPSGGADAAIHEAAGPELAEYCKRLGGVSVGEARITPAFNLPCKYVIHTAGPRWSGGLAGERVLLRSCYKESMKLAIQHRCKTVAFPLIASGLYGYPKDKVLKEATDVLAKFLEHHEMDIYIVVYDKDSYSISRELYDGVLSFVESHYVGAFSCSSVVIREDPTASYRRRARDFDAMVCNAEIPDEASYHSVPKSSETPPAKSKRLQQMLGEMDKGFAETLFHYIDKKGLTDVEAYKRSNVGKKTFSKIKCTKDYRPSKITAVSFAIGLHLNIVETRHLLATAGMCLSRSNEFDVIIEYFIVSGKYETIFDVNEVLYQFDQVLLGV